MEVGLGNPIRIPSFPSMESSSLCGFNGYFTCLLPNTTSYQWLWLVFQFALRCNCFSVLCCSAMAIFSPEIPTSQEGSPIKANVAFCTLSFGWMQFHSTVLPRTSTQKKKLVKKFLFPDILALANKSEYSFCLIGNSWKWSLMNQFCDLPNVFANFGPKPCTCGRAQSANDQAELSAQGKFDRCLLALNLGFQD